MKFVLGLFLVVLLLAALAVYFLFMLNSRSLVPCGDIPQVEGTQMSVTRIYTTDLNADETLAEIINTMNDDENGQITAEMMTELLALHQDIIYAPVFTLDISQADTNTYVLNGSVYNGLDEDGEPTLPDFRYKNLGLTVGLEQGRFLAAENVYEEEKNADEDDEVAFVERKRTIDPIILANGSGAAFSFTDCDSFRLVFTVDPGATPSVTLAYTYDIVADNPLNFVSYDTGLLGLVITVGYDEMGRLVPELTVDRKNIYVESE